MEDDARAEPLNLPNVLADDVEIESAAATAAAARALTSFAEAEAKASATSSAGLPAPPPPARPNPPAAALKPFMAAGTFEGAKAGYVFKRGSLGVGYYRDAEAVALPGDELDSAASGAFGFAPWDPSAAAAQTTKGLSAPPAAANDLWASIDSVSTRGTVAEDAKTAAKARADAVAAEKAAANAKARAEAMAAMAKPKPSAVPASSSTGGSTRIAEILDPLGLGMHAAAFEKAGLGDAATAAALHRSDPAVRCRA